MVMVQGVGTATGPVLVVDTITLPRNSPVALSVPADVTIICVLQKLLFAVVVGGSWTGTLGLILRSPFSLCQDGLDRSTDDHALPRWQV